MREEGAGLYMSTAIAVPVSSSLEDVKVMSLLESACTDPFTGNWTVSVDLTGWELMLCTATGRALELLAIWTRLSVNGSAKQTRRPKFV